jgi:hypothetical protein
VSTPVDDELIEAAVALQQAIQAAMYGQELYDYALFLAQGGPFKITSLGNKADWRPDVLQCAAELGQQHLREYNKLHVWGSTTRCTGRWECGTEADHWHEVGFHMINGVYKALVQATSIANDRQYQSRRSRAHRRS